MREQLNNLRKETETTLRVLYALKQFRLFLTKREYVDKLNKNPDFWMIFETSLRTNLFLGIRRLYEGKSESFNFQNFILHCIKNIDKFSKKSLRTRRISGSNNAHEWIDDFMASVYESKESDFRKLAKIVRINSKKMKGIYTDAASKIYAHAIHMDQASIANITEQLSFDDMELALSYVWHVREQIWQMYENGIEPQFDIGKYPYEHEVIEAIVKQLG